MSDKRTGWIVRLAGRGGERLFKVAEPAQFKALQLAKQTIEMREGDDLTRGMSVSTEDLEAAGLGPGDVKEHGAGD